MPAQLLYECMPQIYKEAFKVGQQLCRFTVGCQGADSTTRTFHCEWLWIQFT